MKQLYIAEKPSVAQAFAKVLQVSGKQGAGYLESDQSVVTWCVGHLVTMCYPEVYDANLKRWSLETIPFLPKTFRYEVIANVKKQFGIVKHLLQRRDIDTIYVCTDAGREGEYIYRLVEMQAQVTGKVRKRVWIDSQTDEEIARGIREAKDLSAYDHLSAAAFLRAKEDYLMGINFSRAMTLKYAYTIKNVLKTDKCVIAVGRVMTCVLGIVVEREREIRSFVKTPYYGVEGSFSLSEEPSKEAAGLPKEQLLGEVLPEQMANKMGKLSLSQEANPAGEDRMVQEANPAGEGHVVQEGNPTQEGLAVQEETAPAQEEGGAPQAFRGIWKGVPGSRYHESQLLYNEKGFRNKADAEALIETLLPEDPEEGVPCRVERTEKKKETKHPPLLYNLAELQNDCSRYFKITPDQTLQVAQELYEKKLTTYPRTDARVLSTAVAKEIRRHVSGLTGFPPVAKYAKAILQHETDQSIHKSRYVNDKAVTDHYAIIPTGQGLGALQGLSSLSQGVFELIARRFLAIFYPTAIYEKLGLTIGVPVKDGEYTEYFFSNFRLLKQKGYLHVLEHAGKKQGEPGKEQEEASTEEATEDKGTDLQGNEALMEQLSKLRKGAVLRLRSVKVKEGETTPPKRYNSGTLILTMENAGQFIEDDELRAQIKGAGIGTSATRAEILKKLVSNQYLQLNRKTQIITPTLLGELIYEAVFYSMKPMLSPKLTASWEKGLSGVAEGSVSEGEYMDKLEDFIRRRVQAVKAENHSALLRSRFETIAPYYKETAAKSRRKQKK